MKRILVLAVMVVTLGALLNGCIVVPDGGGYHHHHGYGDRY
jgi:hypothetical protein